MRLCNDQLPGKTTSLLHTRPTSSICAVFGRKASRTTLSLRAAAALLLFMPIKFLEGILSRVSVMTTFGNHRTRRKWVKQRLAAAEEEEEGGVGEGRGNISSNIISSSNAYISSELGLTLPHIYTRLINL